MKRYIPLVCVIVFIVALLGFSNYIWYEQQRQQEEQSSYETERHIVAVSDMPADVNAELSAAFYKQTGMHVQIISKTDDELHQQMKTAHAGEMPDVLIAAEPVLRQAAAVQQLKPYASIQTETVPYAFKPDTALCGFVGTMRLELNGAAMVNRLLYMLLYNAQYTGIGVRTSLGMGNIQLTSTGVRTKKIGKVRRKSR